MKSALFATLALLCASSCKSSSGAAMAVDEQAMMEKMMAFGTPGDAHKELDYKVGTWTAKVRTFNPDGTTGGEADGTSVCQWIMDGRYLEDLTTGNFQGMPFEGRGLTGYDNIKQKYVGTWVDNMGTGVMSFVGTYDAKTKTFHSESEAPDVMQWRYVPSRSTETMIDRDHWMMKMYSEAPNGKEYMAMQIDYSRTSR